MKPLNAMSEGTTPSAQRRMGCQGASEHWVPAHYEPESSSINFRRSVIYGFGVLWTSIQFVLQRLGLARFAIFNPNSNRLTSQTHPREQQRIKTPGE